MRLVIADDHAIFRQGLRSLLEKDDSVMVVGEAEDGIMALSMAEELTPDIIIMDIAMPVLSGLEATCKIKEKYSNIKIIILSMHTDDIYVHQALKNGAEGYVLKDAAYEELKLAIEAVSEGKPYLSPAVLQSVVDEYLQSIPAPEVMTALEELTAREKEVLQLFAKGCTRQEIAEQLYISPKTVDRHRSNIKEKLRDWDEKEILQLGGFTSLEDL